MAQTIIDFILPEDEERYKEIIANAAERKANAPKAERKPRAPMTTEQKIAADEKRLAKLYEKLQAAKAKKAAEDAE